MTVKEEGPTEIFEITDDSEDENPCRERNRAYSTKGKATGGSVNAQMAEDQPTLPVERVRRYGRGMDNRGMGGRRMGGRGTGNRKVASGRRGRGQSRSEGDREEKTEQEAGPAKKARRSMEKRIRQAERAYQHNTNPQVRRLIQNLEEEALQGQSDSEMEDWEFLLHDPGNTRGRMSLFKQSLHIYWVMKRLLAKALEQVATEMEDITQGGQEWRRELRFIHISLEMQEKKLDELQQMLKGEQWGADGEASQQPGAKDD